MLTKNFFGKIRRVEIMNKKGIDMIRDPIFNKCKKFEIKLMLIAMKKEID